MDEVMDGEEENAVQIQEKRKKQQNTKSVAIDVNGITKLKSPILKFIFYSFLETDKIINDFQNEIAIITQFVE